MFRIQADEVVDPKPRIEKECHKPCERQWQEYEKCKERLKSGKTEGTCEPWAFDYWKCVDKCVSIIEYLDEENIEYKVQKEVLLLRICYSIIMILHVYQYICDHMAYGFS